MTEPTRQTIKKLFALSGNICAFPGCSRPLVESAGTITGEICHIQARNEGGPRFNPQLTSKQIHSFKNLILLCGDHHKIIDDQPHIYTTEVLFDLKKMHESSVSRPESQEDNFFAQVLLNHYKSFQIENNSGNIAINSPGSIQGKNVTVKTTNKRVSLKAPDGTLGNDLILSKYIFSHLISRYNEFASKESSRKTKFSYGAISKNIQSKFGAKWQLLEVEYAQKVISYIQGRIDKTRIARNNRGKNHPSYSTFEEYQKKYSANRI